MTASEFLGGVIIVGMFALMFVATAAVSSWRFACFVWGVSALVTPLLLLGAALLTGELG